MGIASICCAGLALAFAVLGFALTAIPFVGTALAFGGPLLAVVGIVLAGVAIGRARREQDSVGLPIAGLVGSILVLIPSLLVAVTCGLCNACFSAASMTGGGDGARSLGDHGLSSSAPPSSPTSSGPSVVLTAPPTPSELVRAVAHLNEACGDWWCEGEFDYRFQQLACDGSACTVRFTARHYSAGETGPYLPGQIVVPGTADFFWCEHEVVSSPAPGCRLRGLSPDWMSRMGGVLQTWERANTPSPQPGH